MRQPCGKFILRYFSVFLGIEDAHKNLRMEDADDTICQFFGQLQFYITAVSVTAAVSATTCKTHCSNKTCGSRIKALRTFDKTT